MNNSSPDFFIFVSLESVLDYSCLFCSHKEFVVTVNFEDSFEVF